MNKTTQTGRFCAQSFFHSDFLFRSFLALIIVFFCGQSIAAPDDEPNDTSDNQTKTQPTQQTSEDTPEPSKTFLKTRLSKAKLQDQMDKAKREAYRTHLPGGVFKAPKLYEQVMRIVSNFQKTDLVDSDAIFEVFLASTPEINAWVSQVQTISDLKVYHVVVTKGLIDALDKNGGDSLGMLAAVLGHEFGHAMHGDTEDEKQSVRIYHEFNADEFAARLLAAANYNPEGMIEVLKVFERMREDRSLAQLLGGLLDEHPKPSFRIAYIEEIVETLKRQLTAKSELGIEKDAPKRIEGPLDRSGPEKASRTSYDGLVRYLDSQPYKELSYLQKLTALEQFLLHRPGATTDFMARQTIIGLVLDYKRLLHEVVQTPEELDQLIASLKRLEANVRTLTQATSSKEHENVKKTIRKLKSAITIRLLQFSELDHDLLTLKNFPEWAYTLDRQVVLGAINQMVNNATDVAEVESHISKLNTCIDLINTRFAYTPSSDKSNYKDNHQTIFENAAVRVLHLTNNFESAFNFVQALYPLNTQNGEIGMDLLPQVMAGMLHYALTHPGIEFGKLNKRMGDPKTAIDRSYSHLLRKYKDEVSKHLMHKRGLGDTPNPQSRGFSYNIGRQFRRRSSLSSGEVELYLRTVSPKAREILMNDLVKSHFTEEEVFDLLEARGENSEFWADTRSKFPFGAKLREQDLQSQIKKIHAYLVSQDLIEGSQTALSSIELRKQFLNDQGPRGDLCRLYAQSNQIATENMLELHRNFNEAPVFKQAWNDDMDVVIPEYMELNAKNLQRLNSNQRIAYYEDILKSELQKKVLYYADPFAKSIDIIKEGLDELVSEGKLSQTAQNEFMTELRAYSAQINTLAISDEFAPNDEFFVRRRKLQVMVHLLASSHIKVEAKVPNDSLTPMLQLIDSTPTRHSSREKGIELVNKLIVADRSLVIAYLKDPTNTRITEEFRIMKELAAIASRYEGLSGFDNSKFTNIMSIATSLAKDVHAPAEKAVKRKGSSYKMDLYYPALLTDQERDFIMPFDEGFKELLAQETQRQDSTTFINSFYKKALTPFWARRFDAAVTGTEPIDSLVHTLTHISDSGAGTEETARMFYMLLMRTLELVQDKDDMDTFAAILATFFESNKLGPTFGAEFLNADAKKMMDISAARYREHFFDYLTQKLTQHGSWTGLNDTVSSRSNHVLARIWAHLNAISKTYATPYPKKSGDDRFEKTPWPFRIWYLRETILPLIVDRPWYKDFFASIGRSLAHMYTRTLVNRGTNMGSHSQEELYKHLRTNTPWSQVLDEEIANYIETAKFEANQWTKQGKRPVALKLIKQIRSLSVRERTYKQFLKTYGPTKVGTVQRLKDQWALFVAYKNAQAVWTNEVLEELKQAHSLFAAFKLTEKAWEDHVKKRAAKLGVTKEAAYKLLTELYKAKLRVENPFATEVSEVFPEASRHRDPILEKYATSKSMNYEQLKMLENFKSRNSESPYHIMAKAMFEFLDEYLTKLTPKEKVEVGLYLADFDKEISPELTETIKKKIYGSENRRKALKRNGFYFSLKDMKTFFKETHVEEKLVAYRALFVGDEGIQSDPDAEKILIDRLLFADADMPVYLRKCLRLYMGALNRVEKGVLLSWLLANENQGTLQGPDVVRLVVEKGGIAAAKLAQLIASHGFKLSEEYQNVLEVFKGRAQKIDKFTVLNWIAELLPNEKYEQIKSLDQELGSGSLKIAYLATLKDGRKVVIKVAREFIFAKTAREFEILDSLIQEIQKDPDLRIENLPSLFTEVKRIILTELSFQHEYEVERQHKVQHDARPLLVRLIGSSASVHIPQPLEGWQGERILVEEFVPSRDWDDLPETSMTGWSKRKLAMAAIDEVLNQLLTYVEATPGDSEFKILLDIDPHEHNQLAKKSWLGRTMVNIDLGQSLEVQADVVRRFVEIIYIIKHGDVRRAATHATPYLTIESEEHFERFVTELDNQASKSQDPVEIFTKAIEEVELEGITLKPEYLFFQKLFATLVGLKKHVGSDNYIVRRIEKIMATRFPTQPGIVLGEARRLKQLATCPDKLTDAAND